MNSQVLLDRLYAATVIDFPPSQKVWVLQTQPCNPSLCVHTEVIRTGVGWVWLARPGMELFMLEPSHKLETCRLPSLVAITIITSSSSVVYLILNMCGTVQ